MLLEDELLFSRRGAGTLRGSSILLTALTIPSSFPCIESASALPVLLCDIGRIFLQPFDALTRVGEAVREIIAG